MKHFYDHCSMLCQELATVGHGKQGSSESNVVVHPEVSKRVCSNAYGLGLAARDTLEHLLSIVL